MDTRGAVHEGLRPCPPDEEGAAEGEEAIDAILSEMMCAFSESAAPVAPASISVRPAASRRTTNGCPPTAPPERCLEPEPEPELCGLSQPVVCEQFVNNGPFNAPEDRFIFVADGLNETLSDCPQKR